MSCWGGCFIRYADTLMQRAADAAIAGDAAAADRVDHAARGVRAVLDREPQLELDRRVAEAAPLHAQEADLVVALPGDVVARADVDRCAPAAAAGSTLCTASVFERRFEPVRRAVQHVEEVGVAAGVELVRAVERDAAVGEELREHAVHDGGADLRLDVVADDRDAAPLELGRPLRVRHDEDRDAVDEGDARLEAGPRVVLGRLLAADGQVVDQYLGAARRRTSVTSAGRRSATHERLLRRIVAHVLRRRRRGPAPSRPRRSSAAASGAAAGCCSAAPWRRRRAAGRPSGWSTSKAHTTSMSPGR